MKSYELMKTLNKLDLYEGKSPFEDSSDSSKLQFSGGLGTGKMPSSGLIGEGMLWHFMQCFDLNEKPDIWFMQK